MSNFYCLPGKAGASPVVLAPSLTGVTVQPNRHSGRRLPRSSGITPSPHTSNPRAEEVVQLNAESSPRYQFSGLRFSCSP